MNNLITNESLTMTHNQIAKLVSSRPDKVKQSMERLAEKGVIQLTPMGEVNHLGQSVTVYHVNERDSYIVVAQLSPEFTAFLVDEWQKRKAVPELTHEQQVLMIATQLIETTKERNMALIEVDRIQGVCNTITAQFASGVTAPKFCKQMNGCNTQQVNNRLIKMGKLARRKDGVIPTAYSRDRYFIEKQEDHNGKLRSHAELTLVGAKWLYRAYLSNKLPMKANWNGNFGHLVFKD